MPYITAVVGLLNADGSNPVLAKPDGTRESPVIQLGAGLTFTGDIRGRVIMNATSGFLGEITDAQHGNRGGGTLHAEASGSAAGFLGVAHWTLLTDATENPTALSLARRGSSGELGAAWFFVGAAASAASSGSLRLPDGGTIMAAPFGGAGPDRTLVKAGSPNECQIGGSDTNDTTVRLAVKSAGSIIASVGAGDVLTIDATALELAIFDVMFTDGGAVTFSQDPSTGSGATAPTWSMTAPAATGGGGSTGGAMTLGTGTGDTPGAFTVNVGGNPVLQASSAQIVLSTYAGATVISHNTGTDTSTVTDGVATVNHSATTRWFLQFTSGTATPAIDSISTAGLPNLGLFGAADSVGQGIMTWSAAGVAPGSNPSAGSIYAYVGTSVTTPRFLDPGGTTHRLKNGGGWRVTDVKVAAYNAVVGDHVRADPSGGNFTVTLPASAEVGDQIRIKNVAGSGTVTADVAGGGTIDGAATDPVTTAIARGCKTYMWDGAEWELVAIA